MILVFPNFDTLRLALTAGGIPETVSSASARAFFDDQGQAWIEPSVALASSAEKELHRLGVTTSAGSPHPLDQTVTCWPQLLPLQREPLESLDEKTPILFQLAAETQLAEVVSEILRLGNDRQGFRWLAQGEESGSLLRVVGPPYYSLLRALDFAGHDGAPVAYREVQPGVWVQLGYRHPLQEHLRPPAGKLLLMRPPRLWTHVDEAPFRDIYEVLDFAAPEPLVAWQDADLGRRWTIPLRLTKGGSMEPAELWVLRGDNMAQVDEFVQNADDQLLARLAFAVGDKNGQRLIVLRARPSRQPPPVVVLGGMGYRPHLRLPNLFLPCSTRLHPPLRRDVVAKLLGGDPKQVTWLHPDSDGRFTPESLPDSAFRPMHDWLDYVTDQEVQPLTAWVQATRFDFEPFVCRDDQPAKKPKPREPKQEKPKPEVETRFEPEPAPEEVKKSGRKKKDALSAGDAAPIKPSEAEEKLRKLEKEFLEAAGPLDSPTRQALWPRMAQLNGVLGQTDSAGICWGHALWETDSPQVREPAAQAREPQASWFRDWLRVESPQANSLPAAEELEAILDHESPTLSQVRLVLTAVVWAGHENALPAGWKRLLGRIPQMLEKHESILGIRPLWLAWTSLHRLTHGDVLALARARDRLLERLYLNGLSADLDLPNFLRFTGAKASERHRLVRDQLLRLLPLVEKFIQRGSVPVAGTQVYVDLMFAYALARLGETTEARRLMQRAPKHLEARDEVHQWLIAAFEHRLQKAFEGHVAAGRLPAPLLERLEDTSVVLDRLARYKIDRMREHSRILEPQEKIDPYRRWHGKFADDLSRELADLFDVEDQNKLLTRLKNLLGGQGKWARGKDAEPRIVATALELAPRLGEPFGDLVLERCESVLDKVPDPLDRALLLEKGLFLAGHYDRNAMVQSLMGRFHALLHDTKGGLPLKSLETLLGQGFRSLRKLGLRDGVGQLLERMAGMIENHPTFTTRRSDSKTGFGERLRLLLQVAGGWFYFGEENRARPILDLARDLLFQNELVLVEQTSLACAYAATLGQAPMDLALNRIMELFRKLEGVYDTFTTHTHFSLSRLDLIEATLLALVSDDFTVAPEARRLLDDDEYLVRRRIHRDVRRAMEGAGM